MNGEVDADLILVLRTPAGEGLETEDLIDVKTYASAVNAELALWNTGAPQEITPNDLGANLRTKALEAWCKSRKLSCPDKIAVAERVVALPRA